MRRKGGLWFLGFLLLFSGCSREEAIPLQDGRILRVWEVTYGTNHLAPGQSAQVLDKRLRGLPILRLVYPPAAEPFQTLITARPTLVMWTHPLEASTNSCRPLVLRLVHPRTTSAAGYFRNPQDFSGMPGTPVGGSVTIEVFPRRARMIPLEVQENPVGSRAWSTSSAVLHLRNPHPYQGPSWTPDTLPTTQTNSGIQATLFDLTVTNRTLTNGPELGLTLQQTSLRFEALGPEGKPLRVLGYQLSDPGGNLIHVPVGKTLDRSTPHAHQAALFPDEPAWRLKVETDSPVDDPAATLERIEFSTRLGDPKNEAGARLQRPNIQRDMISAKVPGMHINLSMYSDVQNPRVEVAVQRRPVGVWVELERVRDEFGRDWKTHQTEFGRTLNENDYITYTMAPTDSSATSPKSLSLSFRIYRTAIFQFHPPATFRSPPP